MRKAVPTDLDESAALSAKRIFDVTVASLGLVALSPLFLALALVIRAKLGTPVLFRQRRPGLHGAPFTLLKFRTMHDRRRDDGSPTPDADRLTPFGRFLRSTSLDELPELWNVVRGEMSLVGPRPLLMEYLALYTPDQARRHDVRPGITGLAQISGRNELSWDQKFELDVRYVETRSFRLDLRILAKTILRVIRREGISQQSHATMAPFEGSASS